MCAQTFNFCQSIHKFWPTTQHRALVVSSWMKYILVKKKWGRKKFKLVLELTETKSRPNFRGADQWFNEIWTKHSFALAKIVFQDQNPERIWSEDCLLRDVILRGRYGLNQTKLFGPNKITTGFAHKVALRQFVNFYCAERWKTLWSGFRSICICKNACLSIINKFML